MSKFNTTADGLSWYALMVEPQKEFAASDILQQFGCRTFLPRETRWRWANRYAKTRRLKREIEFPIWAGMVFAGFQGTPPWLFVFDLPFIRGVMGVAGVPRQLGGKDFEVFKRQHCQAHRAPSEQRYMLTHREFAAGDEVDVLAGPLRDRRVTVHEIVGPMAIVLLPFLGRDDQPFEVPLDYLEAA